LPSKILSSAGFARKTPTPMLGILILDFESVLASLYYKFTSFFVAVIHDNDTQELHLFIDRFPFKIFFLCFLLVH
jgi:hypothetical protein